MTKVTPIEWTEDLKTSHAGLDAQHKELLTMVNELGEAINQGQGAATMKRLFSYALAYADWHFRYEEELAAKYQCPIAERNLREHTAFRQLIAKFEQKYKEARAAELAGNSNYEILEQLAVTFHQQLNDWIMQHIAIVDKQIGEYVTAVEAAKAEIAVS
ncbi:hemerythrin family protein [Thermosynechococcus sichuanensis E542]|uniref:Hemerythrin family protein n=1 Tax=Thermosynechococcus sichuanensis E542 TaxID=2016101 RepID=A0A3B7MG22_9CYAN|nr:hemerythrin family protein [Thermosynechococcus vestitus]AXY68505.1 hemerythrin family protein [Thermosynechococcus vestitus E542]